MTYNEAKTFLYFQILVDFRKRGLNKEDNGKNFTPIRFIYLEILHFEVRGISIITDECFLRYFEFFYKHRGSFVFSCLLN